MYFCKWKENQEIEGQGKESREEYKKGRGCVMYMISIPHADCNHYVLKMCTNKSKNKNHIDVKPQVPYLEWEG